MKTIEDARKALTICARCNASSNVGRWDGDDRAVRDTGMTFCPGFGFREECSAPETLIWTFPALKAEWEKMKEGKDGN